MSSLSWTTHLKPVLTYVGWSSLCCYVQCRAVHVCSSTSVCMYVCMSVCLQFARSLVERGYPKVCCVQGGAQRLRSLGLLASVGKDP